MKNPISNLSVVLNSASVGEESKDNRNVRPSTRTASAGANSGNLRTESPDTNCHHVPKLGALLFFLFFVCLAFADRAYQDCKQWLLYRRECLCGECIEGFCMAPNVEDGKCGKCQERIN